MLSSDDFLFLYGCLGFYLGVTLVVTRRVARAMSAISRQLLVRFFGLDGETAQGVARGLVVGFYLVNVGLLFYRMDAVNARPENPVSDIFSRLGGSLLLLGLTYYLSLAAAVRVARAARRWTQESEAKTGSDSAAGGQAERSGEIGGLEPKSALPVG
ncbi:MAG: hypothetical protein ABI379_00285 [Rhodanobacter sp.]